MNTSGPTCLRSTGLVDDYMVKRSPFVTAQEVKNSLEYAVHETYPKKETELGKNRVMKNHSKSIKNDDKWTVWRNTEQLMTQRKPSHLPTMVELLL